MLQKARHATPRPRPARPGPLVPPPGPAVVLLCSRDPLPRVSRLGPAVGLGGTRERPRDTCDLGNCSAHCLPTGGLARSALPTPGETPRSGGQAIHGKAAGVSDFGKLLCRRQNVKASSSCCAPFPGLEGGGRSRVGPRRGSQCPAVCIPVGPGKPGILPLPSLLPWPPAHGGKWGTW